MKKGKVTKGRLIYVKSKTKLGTLVALKGREFNLVNGTSLCSLKASVGIFVLGLGTHALPHVLFIQITHGLKNQMAV